MAKVGFWLNGSKGKLAGATMYKDKSSGETIIREVVTPSNPKTDKQIIQRIIMHTVMNAYSKMKEICDHSFEGQKAGRETMGYFMKQNVQLCRESVQRMQEQAVDFYDMYNFLPLGYRQFVANQYQVAMGSLPSVQCIMATDSNSAVVPAITTNTYQGVIDALGLQRGDQLTFMMIVSLPDGVTKEFRFARVILDPTDPETHLQAPLSTPFISGGAVNFPSVRNEGTIRFNNDLTNGLNFGATNAVISAAVIVSRQVGEDWLRSTTYLTYRDNMDYSLGECMDRAANGSTPIYAPNEYYLNNAGEGNATAVETGENSGAGSGNGQAPAVTVQSVVVGGTNAVPGTQLNLTQEGDSPTAVQVVTTLNNASSGTVKIVKISDNSVAANGTVNAQGVATISVTPVYGATYKVVYNVGGSDVNSGYTFQYNKSTGFVDDPDGD